MSENQPKPESLQTEISKQETKLSPEIIELVMEKVENILKPDLAFHVLNANRQPKERDEILGDMLRDGILGITRERKAEQQKAHYEKRPPSHTQRGAYVDDVKSGGLPQIWFEINGRIQLKSSIEDSIWMNTSIVPVNIAIVFDLSHFTDGIGTHERYEQQIEKIKKSGSKYPKNDYIQQQSSIGTFFPATTIGPSEPQAWMRGLQKTKGEMDTGFVLLGRVSPRYFKGIVLKVNREVKEHVDPTHTYSRDNEESDPVAIQTVLKKIVDMQLKIYKLTPDKILPVYDRHGNLLWPRQMSRNNLATTDEEK